jgi:3-oxoacyl-[acyl-carrier protein] reductase
MNAMAKPLWCSRPGCNGGFLIHDNEGVAEIAGEDAYTTMKAMAKPLWCGRPGCNGGFLVHDNEGVAEIAGEDACTTMKAMAKPLWCGRPGCNGGFLIHDNEEVAEFAGEDARTLMILETHPERCSTMSTPKVALVTGASRGIGRGIAIELGKKGYAVAVNYAGNRAAAEETGRSISQSLLVQADVSNPADRARLVETVLAQWGRIDVLVNNAGITSVGRRDILEATEESWDAVLGTNLKGPFFLTQRVANEMIRQAIAGSIVNVSSLSAVAASVNRGDYCISKAGMAMMTQLFAIRLAEHNIRVIEARPGIIDTDMTSGARDRYLQRIADGLTPIRRLGTPEDIGRGVANLLEADLPYSTGDVYNFDGGYHLRKL